MAKLLSNTRVYGTATVDTQLFIQGSNSAHSTNTGALQVSGGIGVAGSGFFSGTVTATNFVGLISGTAQSANNVVGGTAGQLVYQSAPNTTAFAGPGTAGQILTSNGTGAPVYVNTATFAVGLSKNLLGGSAGQFAYQTAANSTDFVSTASMYVGRAVLADSVVGNSVGTATNLAGGTAGQVPYQTGSGATGFYGPGTAGQLLVSAGAAAPVYTNTASVFVGNATLATDLRGGSAGQIVFQSNTNDTDFVGPGTAGQVLTSNGTAGPVYVNTGSLYVGRATIADTVVGGTGFVNSEQQTANAPYYLLFVDANNAVATAENVFTTSTFVVNPSTGFIGLGTTTPSDRLELSAAANAARIRLTNTTAGRSSILGHDASGFYYQPTSSSDLFQLRNDVGTAQFTYNPNTSYIGIGTTGPSEKLHVDGGTGDTRIRVSADDGTNYRGFEVRAGTTFKGGLLYRTNEGDVLQVWGPNISSNAIQIDANNMVSVRATTSAHSTNTGALQVSGGIGVAGSGFFGGVVTATTFVGALTGSISGNAATVSTQRSTSTATHFLTFVDANNASATAETVLTTSSVVVTPSTGFVGIGTNTVGFPLTVVSSDLTAGEVHLASFHPSTRGDGSVSIGYVSTGTNDSYGFVRSRHSVDFGLGAGQPNHVFIKQSGNVGIGTTSPAGLFSVATVSGSGSTVTAWGSGHAIFGPNVGSTTGAALGLTYNTTGDRAEILSLAPNVAWKPLWLYSSGLEIYAAGAGHAMSVTTGGLVGIGTTSPAYLLDIRGGGGTQARISSTTTDASLIIETPSTVLSSTNQIILKNNHGTAREWSVRNRSGAFYIADITSGTVPITIEPPGPNTAIYVQAGGNVGIGTVPSARLHVETTSSSEVDIARFRVLNGANGVFLDIGGDEPNRLITFDATGVAACSYIFRSGGTERMRITSGGLVGIGTSSPQSKLDVRDGYITAGSGSSTAGTKIIGGFYSGSDCLTTLGSMYSSGGTVLGYGVWPGSTADPSFISSTGIGIARSAYYMTGATHIWYNAGLSTVTRDSAVTLTERMRLDSNGNLGIGASSPAYALDAQGSGSVYLRALSSSSGQYAGLLLANSGASGQTWEIGVGGNTTPSTYANNLYFYGNGSPRMIVTPSGNVLIGTATNPTSGGFTNNTVLIKQIADGVAGGGLQIEQSGSDRVAFFGFTGSAFRIGTSYRTSGTYQGIEFWTNGSTRASLTTDGFFGIGTTSPSSTLDIFGLQTNSSGTSAISPTGTLRLSFAGAPGLNEYGASLVFSQYWWTGSTTHIGVGQITGVKTTANGNFGGGLAFWTSNGTNNNLTERMRIDHVGNLGIGTASPSGLLHVANLTSNNSAYQHIHFLSVNNSTEASGESYTSSAPSFGIAFRRQWSSSTFTNLAGIYGFGSSGWRGGLLFRTKNNTTSTGEPDIDALYLSPAGNVGVGTTNPQHLFVVSNGGAQGFEFIPSGGILQLYNRSTSAYGNLRLDASQLLFFTGSPAERMRINSDGAVLIGRTGTYTGSSDRFVVDGGISAFTRDSGYPMYVNRNTNTGILIEFSYGGFGGKGNISTDGTNVAYNTSSDRRLKLNIQPANSAGNIIDNIEIVEHDWITGMHTRYGVVAQDLYEVVPEAVKVGDNEQQIKETWGVDYSKLVPILVKEIQELRARVAALEDQNK